MNRDKKVKNKSIFALLKGHYPYLILSALLVIFHRVSYSYVPLFTQYIIKFFDPSGNPLTVNLPTFVLEFFGSFSLQIHVVIVVAVTFLGYQLMRFGLMIIEKRLVSLTQEKIAFNLRVKLFEDVQNLTYHYHNTNDTGDLIQRVTNDVETSTGFVVTRVMEALGLLSSLLSGAFQMYFLSPTLMYIALATIPVYAVSSLIYFKKIEPRYEKEEELESDILTVIQENIHNNKIVKAFANEGYEVKKLEEKNKAFRDYQINTNKIMSLYWSTSDFIALTQYLVITLVSISLAKHGLFDAADSATALMLVGMLIWPVRGLGRLINEYSKANVANRRINEVFNETNEFDINGTLKPILEGNIVFDHVYFKFPNSDEYSLIDLNFTINKGDYVAIVGYTGSGKSTIVNILLRNYEYEGSIKIDGVELRDIEKHYLRKNIGSVLQTPFLYSKTIEENINITSSTVDRERIIRASEIATIDKEINMFDKGYDTIVGERGTTLSGGQKQRVAIARILLEDKPILLFDDALSAVDNKTDVAIRQALGNKEHKATTIIITHRITTAKEADKIIILNNKRIEDIGVHSELSQKEGLYKKLWAIQGNLEQEFLAMIERGGK